MLSGTLSFNSTSKTFLHENYYGKAKELFNLNTALIQTARDKAIEILKSHRERGGKGAPRLRRVSIRFDKRCYKFSKTTNTLTPYWLTLSLRRGERISLPILFGERQRQRIEEALRGEWQFTTVEMVKPDLLPALNGEGSLLGGSLVWGCIPGLSCPV
ncbi:MAG: hypothetical protein QW604_01885 [Fervidicoccaceae archaeon]